LNYEHCYAKLAKSPTVGRGVKANMGMASDVAGTEAEAGDDTAKRVCFTKAVLAAENMWLQLSRAVTDIEKETEREREMKSV